VWLKPELTLSCDETIGRPSEGDFSRKAVVLRHHFNPSRVNYLDWCRSIDEQLPALLDADDNSFEDGIRKLLEELRSSHTNFYHSNTQPALPQHAIGATIKSVQCGAAPRWMVLDVFEQSPAARAGLRPGQFLQTLDGMVVRPPALPVFRFGYEHHLSVDSPSHSAAIDVVLNVPARKQSKRPPLIEPRSVEHRILRKVGILKIPFFPGAFGIRFSRLLDRAIQSFKIQGCDRLVIDLRGVPWRKSRLCSSRQLHVP
jgi:C-terminal processing protease CtpA/Prc